MQQKILVTGSEGLIGSAIIQELKKKGMKTVQLDIDAENPAHQGDVRDFQTVKRALAGCLGVIHLAAVSIAQGYFLSHNYLH